MFPVIWLRTPEHNDTYSTCYMSAKSANSLFWMFVIKIKDHCLPSRHLQEITHCTLVVILQLMYAK